MGGLRSSAQMISYELAMGLSVIGVIMLTGSFSLVEIVKAQESGSCHVRVLSAARLRLRSSSSLAEINRTPFDLPEAEGELVAGYHTEYSSMKFAIFSHGRVRQHDLRHRRGPVLRRMARAVADARPGTASSGSRSRWRS